MKSVTVMITGAGAPGAPGVIRSLRENGERPIRVVGLDAAGEAVGFRLADKGYKIPMFNAPDFIDELLRIALDEKADVILPLVTKELELLSFYKDRFLREGVMVSVSDYSQLKTANNKGKLLTCLKEAGFQVPIFSIAETKEDFVKAAQGLGYPDRPICFKPAESNGSRGFRIIDTSISRYKLLFEMKPASTYIAMDEIISIYDEFKALPPLIVMEYLPGSEYSVDLLADHGRPLYTVPRRRDAISGGISIRGEIVNEYDVINYCNEIVRSLKLHGNIGIQVKRDQNNVPLILEVNPRIQGTIVHCTEAGVNLPYFAVKMALHEEIPAVNIKWNCKMIRYWNEVFY